MRKRFFFGSVFSFVLLMASFAPAETFKVKLKDGVERTVDFISGESEKPVVVLVNGLVYHYDRWDPVVEVLKGQGYPVLRYYFRGQHQTLVNELKQKGGPTYAIDGITSEKMGDELAELLAVMKLTKPVVVVGLSYGAHVAAQFAERHPKQVLHLSFFAPLVKSLDKYDPQGAFLSWNLEQIKFWWGPVLGPTFYEYAYRVIYRGYLDQRVMPENTPLEFRDHPHEYKEALFHLVRAARDFDLTKFKFAKLNPRSVSFFLAQEESAAVFKDQQLSANNLKARNLRSLIYLPQSSHAIPDSQGGPAAQILVQVLRGESGLAQGNSFVLRAGRLEPLDPE